MFALHKFVFIHLLTCLGQNALGSEIINGEVAPKNDMLYMASLQKFKSQAKWGHVCGGALVAEDFVLTAAHCDTREPLRVVLGTHNLKKRNKIVSGIVKKCKHPSYINIFKGHDLMLLKLSEKVQPSKRVKFIQLPSSEMIIKEDEKCRVAGWGLTATYGKVVNKLRVVDVSVINLKVCKEQWPFLPDSVICAGGYNTTKGTCMGDSGGPLVYNGTAVGVVSFGGRTCDYPGFPDVYADISRDLDWINQILKEKNC